MFKSGELKKRGSLLLAVGLILISVVCLMPLIVDANIITSAKGDIYLTFISAYYVSLWPLILIAMGALFYRRSILLAHTTALLLVLVLVLITTVFWERGYYGYGCMMQNPHTGNCWYVEPGYSVKEFYSDLFFVFNYVFVSTLIAFVVSWIMSAFRRFRKIQLRMEFVPRWKKIIGMSLVYILPFSLLGYFFSSLESLYFSPNRYNTLLPLLIGLSGLPVLFFVFRYFMRISKDFSVNESVELMNTKRSLTYLAILIALSICMLFLFPGVFM